MLAYDTTFGRRQQKYERCDYQNYSSIELRKRRSSEYFTPLTDHDLDHVDVHLPM